MENKNALFENGEVNNVKDIIYTINGVQVMLDSDLAILYGVETKRINEAVKNNPLKFPDRYYFKVSEEEYCSLKSKFSTSKGGSRKGHTAFVEQGIYMLATILKSDVATKVTINIMDTFVNMRKIISSDLMSNKILLNHEERLLSLEQSFNEFNNKTKDNIIFFNGQIYDAYSKIIDILKESHNSIVIIDNYADKELLDIIKNLNVKVILITSSKSHLSNNIINKYNKEYNNLRLIYNDTFHDRYFIIDNKVVYHCGTSINRIGYKTFSINKINDNDVINSIYDKVNNML